MREITRKEAIMWLKIIRANIKLFPGISASKKIKALSLAINSLEIDEIYDLEYEKIRRQINEDNTSHSTGADSRK